MPIVQYSDWFNATQPATTITSPAITLKWGVNNRHYKRAAAALTVTTFDATSVCRLLTLKRSDVIAAIDITNDGVSTGTACDVGLHAAGTAHDGAVVDADEFATALAINAAAVSANGFVNSPLRKGTPVWEIAGYSTMASAPEEFDLTLTCTTAVATGNEGIVVEVFGSFS